MNNDDFPLTNFNDYIFQIKHLKLKLDNNEEILLINYIDNIIKAEKENIENDFTFSISKLKSDFLATREFLNANLNKEVEKLNEEITNLKSKNIILISSLNNLILKLADTNVKINKLELRTKKINKKFSLLITGLTLILALETIVLLYKI